MLVPEAAMNKYHGGVPRQYEVRPPFEIAAMQTETQTCAVQTAAQNALGTRVRASYARHVVASLDDRQPVCHQLL
jgi:hypothetical protein